MKRAMYGEVEATITKNTPTTTPTTRTEERWMRTSTEKGSDLRESRRKRKEEKSCGTSLSSLNEGRPCTRGPAARTTVTTPLLPRLALGLSPANGVSRRRVRSESGEEKASRVIGRERGSQRAIGQRFKACCFSSLFLLALVMLIVMVVIPSPLSSGKLLGGL